jgi:outer membrane murein-binding lipoprotein Lpp
MKIVGILLILGALIGGGIILSDTVPGYLRNKDRLAKSRDEIKQLDAKLAAVQADKNAPAAAIQRVISESENAIQQLHFDEESVTRRRNETLMFGGSAVILLAAGVVLFLRGRRSASATRPLTN